MIFIRDLLPRWLVLAVLIFSGLASAGFVTAEDPGINKPRDPRCGLYCLYVAEGALGKQSGAISELEKGLGKIGGDGYSIDALKDQAIRDGFFAIVVKTDLPTIATIQRPFACVALTKRPHFVLLSDVQDGQVHVIDAPRDYVVPVDTFVQDWQGYALILSEVPIRYHTNRWIWIAGTVVLVIGLIVLILVWRRSRSAAFAMASALLLASAGCSSDATPGQTVAKADLKATEVSHAAQSDLHAEPARVDLGTTFLVPSDQTKVVRASLVNQLDHDVTILKIKPGCSCTNVKLETNLIRSHSSVIFEAVIHLGGSEAQRRNVVIFETDDPTTPAIEVAYTWNTVNTLHVPQKEIIVRQDGKFLHQPIVVDIQSRGLSLCPECVVESKSQEPLITNYEPGISTESLSTHESPNSMIESPTSFLMGRVRLELSERAIPCEIQSPVELVVHCKGIRRASIQFPVNVRVFPDLKVLPDRLFLGVVTPGAAVRSDFTVSKPDGSLFAIKAVSCPGFVDNIAPEFDEEKLAKHTVSLKIRTPDQKGVWRAILAVSLNTGETISVPVSALIQD